MRFSTFALTFGVSLCLALPGLADNCATIAGNLVSNCGFEDGTYTFTIPYIQPPNPNSDPSVPNFWTANPSFVEGYIETAGAVGDVITSSGTDYLSIGTGQFGSLATLSTELPDVAGVTYDGSLNVEGGTGTFLVVLDNSFGGPVISVNAGGGSYSFSFVGSGADELTLAALGGPWHVDDVVITAAGASEVPEPRAAFLIPFAVIGCLLWLSRRRRPVLLIAGYELCGRDRITTRPRM